MLTEKSEKTEKCEGLENNLDLLPNVTYITMSKLKYLIMFSIRTFWALECVILLRLGKFGGFGLRKMDG